jgi:hypothetical protein
MFRDTVEGFELTDQTRLKYSMEFGAIVYLSAGLEHLYRMVRDHEVRKLGKPISNIVHPGVRLCAFHWYAVTACNLVKLIGWLRHQQDPAADSSKAYLEKVLPAVLPWRNKVAAHFAIHTPHGDPLADLRACLIPPTARVNGRYTAGSWTVSITKAGKTSSSQLLPWSLTLVHEGLRKRYGLETQTGGK